MAAKMVKGKPLGFYKCMKENQELILKSIVDTTRNLTDPTQRYLQPQVWLG